MTLRMAVWAGSLSFLLVHGVGCTPPAGDEAAVAKAEIKGKEGTTLTGTATFTAGDAGTQVVIELKGATPGEHGVHVHETGDCSAADFTSSGGHFNPDGKKHGRPTDAERHAGDLGNIKVEADGTGKLELTDSILTVKAGDTYSVIGKAIIVHEKADDFGQPTGNAGARIGCGEIK